MIDSLEGRVSVLEELSERIHATAREKGFYTEVISAEQPPPVRVDYETVGLKLALIHSEVTEILEAVRKEQGTDAIADEFADVLIRLLDLYQAMRDSGLYGELKPLSKAVTVKVAKNEARPKLHGNLF